jgi:hypothetical protein
MVFRQLIQFIRLQCGRIGRLNPDPDFVTVTVRKIIMHITINHVSQFHDAFRDAGREKYFSYEGLGLLFDYLEDVQPHYDLDVIELCCNYSEKHFTDIASNYGIDLSDCEDEDTQIEVVRDYLAENTALVGEPMTGTFLYLSF